AIAVRLREFQRPRAGAGQPGERSIVQIDRTQSSRLRSCHIGRGLQDVELRSQSGSEIRFCDLERVVGGLNILGFGLENTVGLFQIEKYAADFRSNSTSGCFQGLHRCVTPSPRRLKPALSRKAIEHMPGPTYSYKIAVVKLATNVRVPFVVDLVRRKHTDVWAKFTLIDRVLFLLDVDIFLAGLDFRAICIRANKALV